MSLKTFSQEEIESLMNRFEKGILPKEEWTHEAHLVVGFWYAMKFDPLHAMEKIRSGIIRHNESVGTPNTDHEGYHETITQFWLNTILSFLKENSYASIADAYNAFSHTLQAQTTYPLHVYSREILFSVYARHNWVEPNLTV